MPILRAIHYCCPGPLSRPCHAVRQSDIYGYSRQNSVFELEVLKFILDKRGKVILIKGVN